MIHLKDHHRAIISSILNKYPYKFYAFGSRVKGTHREFSDLDLCYKETIPLNELARLQEEFEESDLPFTVDIIDWNACADDFKRFIEHQLELCSSK